MVSLNLQIAISITDCHLLVSKYNLSRRKCVAVPKASQRSASLYITAAAPVDAGWAAMARCHGRWAVGAEGEAEDATC